MQSNVKIISPGLLIARRMSTREIDYQFLQRSKLPTMYFQRSLPRLPIPLLPKTCERFLAGVQPILDDQEYATTQEHVRKFQDTGMQLQALLKQKDERNKQTSYISEPWFDMYLRDRLPLPMNYNPLLVLKHDQRSEYQAQIVRATNLVVSSLRFWRSLQAGILEPEVYHLNPKKSDTPQFRKWMSLMPTAFATYAAYAFKAFPLDMSQYRRLFGGSRIPNEGKDYLVNYPNSKHIMVIRRGNLYTIDVLDSEGNILAPYILLARLRAVIDVDDKTVAAKHPLGVLTSLDRDVWAKTRKHLIKISSQNQKLLEEHVDSALFCLALDSDTDPIYNEARPQPLLKNMLAGDGRNRWFDKSVSILIANDGTTAVNFEHSWGDGVAVLRYVNEIYKETIQRPFVSTKNLSAEIDAQSVRPIVFDIDAQIEKEILNGIEKNTSIMNNFEMDIISSNLNKRDCKREKISPDSIMQLSFQLAYRQAFNSYVGTYESCSTSAFRHGRTETVRPCTMATKKFCESILRASKDGAMSNKEYRAMLMECSTRHGQLTKEAAMGQGFDRHLFGLKHIAAEENLPIPDLYHSKAYKKINYNIISTSTLSSDAILAGAFGPVVNDGLGIGYSIQDDQCGAIVTSFKNEGKGSEFASSLLEAFKKIHQTLQ